MTQSFDLKSTVSIQDLAARLDDYCIIKDPACKDLNFDQLFQIENEIYLIASSVRREVYVIKTPFGNYFLKLSPIHRKKDQRRFLLLPWRIKAEWRNLDKLKRKAIPAPQRVFFGFKERFPCYGFFLVTEDVGGSFLNCSDQTQIIKLADYLSLLHTQGVFHLDLHPENILIDNAGEPILIDVQEVFFSPWLPDWLRSKNIGQLWRHMRTYTQDNSLLLDFLERYNGQQRTSLTPKEIYKNLHQNQERFYKSRSKRCLKNSTEFQIIDKKNGVKGYKRRDFSWGIDDCRTALRQGEYIKDKKLVVYKDICLKIDDRHFFHKDRCLASWKMARALAVRGIRVPETLAYFRDPKRSYFLTRFYKNSLTLNPYLSSITDKKEKSYILKQLAKWIQMIHSQNIWQRDFKSSNILVDQGQFIMVDLEGVKKCKKLSLRKKVINLAQLNASISNAISLKDRLRFFHFYCSDNLPDKRKRRTIYQRLWRITQKKNTRPFGLDLNQLHSKTLNPHTTLQE